MSTHLIGAQEMTNDEYHAAPGVSKSHLDLIRNKSPRHYWHRYLNPDREPEEKTAPMKRGTATHVAILQPNEFEKLVICGLDHDRRSKENAAKWAAFEEENAHKTIITKDAYEKIMPLRDYVWAHPEASRLLTNIIVEQSIFGMMDVPDGEGGYVLNEETGKVEQALVKCQPDALARDFSYLLDLKSADDAQEDAFGRKAGNLRYPVQPAWYNAVMNCALGRSPDVAAFLVFEPEPPYCIAIYYMEELDMLMGWRAAERDFAMIEHHRRLNWWPDYAELKKAQALKLPKYVRL
ncbi:PD-(D/E)XK nuclease-like domain-containing protein [Salmonella enterica]|nr:PD-(D/E)XK nuclease-like domain-containing protein [Salmonella enterica]